MTSPVTMSNKIVACLILTIAIVVAVGLAVTVLTHRLGMGTQAPVAWALAVATVSTFFVILHATERNGQVTKSGTRLALTASFTVAYFLLLCLLVFYKGTISKVAETVLSSFSFLMGVIIASYFGTTTWEKVAHIRSVASNPESKEAIKSAAEDAETGA